MARRRRRSSRVHGDTRQTGKPAAIVGILFVMVAIPLLLTDMGLLVLVAWLLVLLGAMYELVSSCPERAAHCPAVSVQAARPSGSVRAVYLPCPCEWRSRGRKHASHRPVGRRVLARAGACWRGNRLRLRARGGHGRRAGDGSCGWGE